MKNPVLPRGASRLLRILIDSGCKLEGRKFFLESDFAFAYFFEALLSLNQ